ncbi:Imm1 family immunity protein [Asanoa sp. NPDC050611]|uniref:Imm1 family immunity protein n=1 Tax=Asanoa sp. NPDC050611 TaxID=3157098 RepID=UPI0033D5D73B
MEYDLYDAGRRQLVVIQSPTIEDVVVALDALDQQRHTGLNLIDGTGAYISVVGGSGRYHVYVGAFDHDDRVILQTATAGPAEVDIFHDGEDYQYAANDVVDRDAALAALTEFHRSGRPDLGLTWRAG